MLQTGKRGHQHWQGEGSPEGDKEGSDDDDDSSSTSDSDGGELPVDIPQFCIQAAAVLIL